MSHPPKLSQADKFRDLARGTSKARARAQEVTWWLTRIGGFTAVTGVYWLAALFLFFSQVYGDCATDHVCPERHPMVVVILAPAIYAVAAVVFWVQTVRSPRSTRSPLFAKYYNCLR